MAALPRGMALAWPGAGLASRLRPPSLRLILLAIAGAACAAIVAGVLFLTLLPRAGFYATYTVLSDSMQPAISIGSIVIVVPIAPAKLVAGEIISYSSAQAPYPTLTHRIQSIRQEDDGRLGFVTKGDYNLVPDPYVVHYSGQAGLVVGSLPLLGYIIAALVSPISRLTLGLGLAALLAFFWFGAVWAKPRVARSASSAASVESGPRRLAEVSVIRTGILAWLVIALVSGDRYKLR